MVACACMVHVSEHLTMCIPRGEVLCAHRALLRLGLGSVLEKALGRIPARLGGAQCILVMLADAGDMVLWWWLCV